MKADGYASRSAVVMFSIFTRRREPLRLMIVIASSDAQSLRAADGVGPKLATRIVTELKDRVGNLVLGNAQAKPVPVAKQKNSKANEQAVIASIDPDVISALINLGYPRSDAFQAVMNAKTKANDNEQNDLSAMIRLALKELSQ